MDGPLNRWNNGVMDRQTDRFPQTDRKTDRQTDREERDFTKVFSVTKLL